MTNEIMKYEDPNTQPYVVIWSRGGGGVDWGSNDPDPVDGIRNDDGRSTVQRIIVVRRHKLILQVLDEAEL